MKRRLESACAAGHHPTLELFLVCGPGTASYDLGSTSHVREAGPEHVRLVLSRRHLMRGHLVESLVVPSAERDAIMKISYLILTGMFLVASPVFARDKVDVLVMQNGDRFTCEIKGLDSGVLYIGLDYVQGTVQVDWSKVRSVESKQLFLVRTQDGRYHTGALSMTGTEAAQILRIEALEDSRNAVEVSHKEVVDIDQTSSKFWQRFNGAINSGMTYSKANESTQYSLGANAQYLRERWSLGADFTSILTGNTGVATSTHNSVTTYYRHLMRWNNWFYTGIGSLLQSTEQEIQLQSNMGAGIGRYLKDTNHATVSAYGGLAYQNTRYTQSESRPPSQNTAAALAGVDAGLFRFDKTKLTLSATAFPALNQPGRIYNNVNATYYLKFWGDFTWNLSFYGSWDSQPPARLSGSDYGVTSGFGWTFGNYNSFSK